MTVTTAIASAFEDDEDLMGVCPWCGQCSMKRITVRDPECTFVKNGELTLRECLNCGHQWGGLYRSALQREEKQKKQRKQ